VNAWPIPAITMTVVLPLAGSLFAPPSATRLRARRLGVGVTAIVFALATAVSVAWHASNGLPVCDRLDPGTALGWSPLFVVDGLNAMLLPFAALIFLFVLLVQPNTLAIETALRRTLLAEATTLAIFLTSNLVLLSVLWCVSAAQGWYELRRQEDGGRGAARVFASYMAPSCVALCLGAGLLLSDVPWARMAGSLLVALAVMVRKGIVPLHSWLPEFFAHAPVPVSVLFNAPQIGALVAVKVVAPGAPSWVVEMISLASLATAVYGAMLALVQDEARRAFAWLFLSQSALILVGLESHASIARAGGLSVWISSGLALAGFGMTIAALEARRGPLSLRRFAGGYERKPLLAACFLVLGLASIGFPGTLGFVGLEALAHGVVSDFPYLGFAVLVAGMLNGIAVVRTYFMLFCGRLEPGRSSQSLQLRERLGFVALAGVLIVGGLFPGPFVRSRSRAGESIRAGDADIDINGARSESRSHSERPSVHESP
jgi:NADH-quinone oxidoreductase subunit M